MSDVWCERCGCEYRVGFTRCADCRIDLVAELPAPTSRASALTHELTEFDLSTLDDDAAALFVMLLNGSGVQHTWELNRRLTVPRSSADEVEEMLAFIEVPTWDKADFAARIGDGGDGFYQDEASILASRFYRWLANYLDGLVLGIGLLVLRPFTPDSWRVELGLWFAYETFAVARWGKTFGKLALGIRVASLGRDVPPSLISAAIRAAVPSLFPFASGLIVDLPVGVTVAISVTWMIAVYAPVVGADRRGLHDRAAATRVLAGRVHDGV